MTGPSPVQPDAVEESPLREWAAVVVRRRRLVIAVLLVVSTAAAIRTVLTRPVYQASAQLLIEREAPNVVTFKEVAQADAGRDDYYQTQYKLLQSRALAREVILDLNLLDDVEFGGRRTPEQIAAIRDAPAGVSPEMEQVVDAFLMRLRVEPIRNSRLVSVRFEAYRPELATQCSNRLSQLYIQQTLDFRFKTSSEAGQWLAHQIDEQQKKAQTAELALQQLKEKDDLVNIEERRTLLDQKLKELGTALTSLQTARLEKEALYRQMRTVRETEELPGVIRDPLIQSLRLDLANLERKEAELLESYLEQHPEVIKVRKQIQETRAKVRTESQRVISAAENEYKAAAAQEGSVASALEATKQQALDLSRRSVQYDSVKREMDASTQVLNSLLARHKETDVTQDLKSSNIRIVDAAVVPQRPIRPNPLRDIWMGVLLGSALSIGLALMLESFDNTIKTADDVRTHLGVPLLGVLPDMGGNAGDLVVLEAGAQGAFLEGYRVLRTALNYCWPDQAPRALAVVSAAPAEGKTTVAVNLALTLASLEGRVLLIDADLRQPRAHDLLKAKKTPGLSDVLVGKISLSEAVQRLPGTNLGFLSSGSPVPSPADLMSNRAMQGLIDGLRGLYNWIVIDTPPVAAVAEALILAPLVDGAIMVVGAEMVPRGPLRDSLQRVHDAGSRILGVVLNRARVELHAYDYGRYYGQRPARPDAGKVARINGKRASR